MQRRVTGDEWAVILGRKHGARGRAAIQAAKAASDQDEDTTKLSLERWPHIVAAMTHLITAYNVSFNRNVLNLTEDRSDPNRPVVTIEAGGDGSPSLAALLDSNVICIRSRDAGGLSCNVERPLLRDRDDDQTAAYVLQDWMGRL
jgi:hypothetical protein